MPFFVIKDELQGNAKAQLLLRSPLQGNKDGPAAFGMWAAAGSVSQAKGSDGVVTEQDLMSLILHRASVRRWAKRLVDVGLWHAEGHECLRCPPVEAGSYLFHDWFDNGGYKTGEAHETARRKSRELALAQLRDAVWARDCTDDPDDPKIGNYRYCGTEVTRSDRKSPRKPELDHVDPSKADGLKNLVLCCSLCNKKKGRKSLEDSGMVLLPEPVRTPKTREISDSKSESTTSDNQLIISGKSADFERAQVSPRADARTHAGALAGSGAGLAGLGGEPRLREAPHQEPELTSQNGTR